MYISSNDTIHVKRNYDMRKEYLIKGHTSVNGMTAIWLFFVSYYQYGSVVQYIITVIIKVFVCQDASSEKNHNKTCFGQKNRVRFVI